MPRVFEKQLSSMMVVYPISIESFCQLFDIELCAVHKQLELCLSCMGRNDVSNSITTEELSSTECWKEQGSVSKPPLRSDKLILTLSSPDVAGSLSNKSNDALEFFLLAERSCWAPRSKKTMCNGGGHNFFWYLYHHLFCKVTLISVSWTATKQLIVEKWTLRLLLLDEFRERCYFKEAYLESKYRKVHQYSFLMTQVNVRFWCGLQKCHQDLTNYTSSTSCICSRKYRSIHFHMTWHILQYVTPLKKTCMCD